jgi:hypothetical protein
MAASAPFPAEPPYEGPALPARSKALSERISEYIASRLFITILLVLLVLAGLPIAVWLDLRNLSERALTEQADELSSTIDSIRNYYASNVVGRILAHGEKTQVLPNYGDVPGAIPIPATLARAGRLDPTAPTAIRNSAFLRLSVQKPAAARSTPSSGRRSAAGKPAFARVRGFRLGF